VCILDEGGQPFSMVLVGALFVGSISTVWHGEITPPTRRAARELTPVAGPGAQLARGDLMGWFNMGSTVVLLFPKGRVQWQAQLGAGMSIRVGQPLGRIQGPQ
jgi:phosphatidylserine decarboxylase